MCEQGLVRLLLPAPACWLAEGRLLQGLVCMPHRPINRTPHQPPTPAAWLCSKDNLEMCGGGPTNTTDCPVFPDKQCFDGFELLYNTSAGPCHGGTADERCCAGLAALGAECVNNNLADMETYGDKYEDNIKWL